MQNTSPFLAMQKLELHIKSLMHPIDFDSLDDSSRKMLRALKQLVIDARLDIRDYELSETREEQLKNANEAKKRLAHIEASIVARSEVFNAVDTAHITAEIDQIKEWIK